MPVAAELAIQNLKYKNGMLQITAEPGVAAELLPTFALLLPQFKGSLAKSLAERVNSSTPVDSLLKLADALSRMREKHLLADVMAMLPEMESITPQGRIMLANAIYFREDDGYIKRSKKEALIKEVAKMTQKDLAVVALLSSHISDELTPAEIESMLGNAGTQEQVVNADIATQNGYTTQNVLARYAVLRQRKEHVKADIAEESFNVEFGNLIAELRRSPERRPLAEAITLRLSIETLLKDRRVDITSEDTRSAMQQTVMSVTRDFLSAQ